MYTTKGYVNTLVVRLKLITFAINGTYGHNHEWKQSYWSVGWKVINHKCSCSISARMVKNVNIRK